jgi:hypothetical protein
MFNLFIDVRKFHRRVIGCVDARGVCENYSNYSRVVVASLKMLIRAFVDSFVRQTTNDKGNKCGEGDKMGKM